MANEKLIVTRTVGFEIEGYIDDGYDYDDLDGAISNADVGSDGSLNGEGEPVEVRTYPLNDLNKLDGIFNTLSSHDFFVDEYAGLHIHVDISDYNVRDRVKLLRFGKAIEYLMFAINKPYRYYGRSRNNSGENGYCTKLHNDWRKVFRSTFIDQKIDYSKFETLSQYCRYVKENHIGSKKRSQIWNGRYQWLNADTRFGNTIEFRIFEAVDNPEITKKFGMLAYHIVETVKNSSLSQLMLIKKSIYSQKTVEDMIKALCEGVGLDSEFIPEIHNQELAQEIDSKFCAPNRLSEVVEEVLGA